MFATVENLFVAARERLGGNVDAEVFFPDDKLRERLQEFVTEFLPESLKMQRYLGKGVFSGSPSTPPVPGDYTVYMPRAVTKVPRAYWTPTGGAMTPLETAEEGQLFKAGKKPHNDTGTPTCFWCDFQAPPGAALTISGISAAAQAVVLCAAPPSVGEIVRFQGITGMTEINGMTGQVISVATGVSFTVDINTLGFTAYAGGTTIYKVGAVPVICVHPYPVPSAAGIVTAEGEGKGLEQPAAGPLVIPPPLHQAALRWLIFDMRETREEFDDAARANAYAVFQTAYAKGLRAYNMTVRDRSVQDRVLKQIGK